MARREVEIIGAEVLRRKAEPVTEFGTDSLRQLVADMYETCAYEEGAGLAAPQVGVSLRLFVLDCSEFPDESDSLHQTFAICNPEVVSHEGKVDVEEGCLSIPEIRAKVRRFRKIGVRGFDIDGNPLEITADGLVSRCIQHELDHLDGVLFVDRLSSLKRQLLKRQLEDIATS